MFEVRFQFPFGHYVFSVLVSCCISAVLVFVISSGVSGSVNYHKVQLELGLVL